MNVEQARAQRWHDTDHGADRRPPLRSNRTRIPVPESGSAPVSACWCCCERCDPGWNPQRSNPYWGLAVSER